MREYRHGGSWYLRIRAWSWEASQKDGRAHEKSISCFENLGLGVSPVTLHLIWYECPPGRIRRMPLHGASRSKVGMPHCLSFRLHRPQSLRQPMLDLLREPLPVVAHTAGEHVRELESSGTFSSLKTKRVVNVDKCALASYMRW